MQCSVSAQEVKLKAEQLELTQVTQSPSSSSDVALRCVSSGTRDSSESARVALPYPTYPISKGRAGKGRNGGLF